MSGFKITMLGASNSGKTAYLTSVFGMMQTGTHGFTLRAADHKLGVTLNANWDRLLEGGPNRFPPPTADVPITYELKVCYALQTILSFDWLDYRGDAVWQDETANSVRELRQHLLTSSCTFLTVPAELLTEPLGRRRPIIAAKSRINQILGHLSALRETLGPTKQTPVPVVVVLTKFDKLVTREGRTIRPNEEILEDVRLLLQPLFAPDSGFLVMICKVSLGPELAFDMADGEVEPLKVHLPILFATYRYLHDFLVTLEDEERSLQAAQPSFWDVLADAVFNGGETVNARDRRLQFIREHRHDLARSLRLIARELADERFYLSGEPWKIDD